MRYLSLVTDYDGTIASDGKVPETTLAALKRLRETGRKLILCTGRELEDFKRVLPNLELFDLLVLENGAVLYNPKSREERCLGEPPPAKFVEALRQQNVNPLSVGRSIVATWVPNEKKVLDEIHKQGLELQVIFNKGAVMVLPAGVNKATGMKAALKELGLSTHSAIGVGDAENDHAFLNACELSVAVSNALPSLKNKVDLVLSQDHGAGVEELVELILKNDLANVSNSSHKKQLLLGETLQGEVVSLPAYGPSVLVVGESGSGKSRFTTGLLERLNEEAYQYCVIDPEGDYENFEDVLSLGDPKRIPSHDEVAHALQRSQHSVAVNLLGVKLEDRPAYFLRLITRILEVRAAFGRPEWIVIDEAHHMLDLPEHAVQEALPHSLKSIVFTTAFPARVSRHVLASVDRVIAVGEKAPAALKTLLKLQKKAAPKGLPETLPDGMALFYSANEFRIFKVTLPKTVRRRHRRKYVQGDLGPDGSFFFRGPTNRLNLRAQNLQVFTQIAEGLDDETWNFHLQRHDVSGWFRTHIKDSGLADQTYAIECEKDGRAALAQIRELVDERYTLSGGE